VPVHGAGGRSNLEDPYITLPEEEAGSDDEDDTLRDSDLLILAARNDDDVSHLEVWLLSFRAE
jgi:periodic tryptophan protein 1